MGQLSDGAIASNTFRDAIDNAVELMRRLDARFPNSAKPR
jgi:hypothetical protein